MEAAAISLCSIVGFGLRCPETVPPLRRLAECITKPDKPKLLQPVFSAREPIGWSPSWMQRGAMSPGVHSFAGQVSSEKFGLAHSPNLVLKSLPQI
jgi:hypothetical protein